MSWTFWISRSGRCLTSPMRRFPWAPPAWRWDFSLTGGTLNVADSFPRRSRHAPDLWGACGAGVRLRLDAGALAGRAAWHRGRLFTGSFDGTDRRRFARRPAVLCGFELGLIPRAAAERAQD